MNTGLNGSREMGGTLVEIAITAPVLLLLGLGIVQTALLLHAKTTLNYAVFEAARKGAVTHAQQAPMRDELALRLAPLFGGSGDTASSVRALARSSLDARDPRFTRLAVISPSRQAFADWAVYNPQSGELEIPNSHLRQRHSERRPKPVSGVDLQTANLLSIEVTYGYKMTVPLVGKLAARMLLRFDPANAVFYLADRLPIKSIATVRMQSPARADNTIVAGETITVSETEPLASATVFTPLPSVVCNEHGLPVSMNSDPLGALPQAEMPEHLCGADIAIADLLDASIGGGEGSSLAGVNYPQHSSSDCVPSG